MFGSRTFLSAVEPFLPAAGRFLCFGHVGYAHPLREASQELGLPWIITPHQLRHSGPSHDRYHRLRSLADIQARGMWKQLASVKIYEKHALLLASMSQLPVVLQRTCRKLERELPGLFRGASTPARKRKR